MDVQLWIEREQRLDEEPAQREKLNLHAEGHWDENSGALAFSENAEGGAKSWVHIEWKDGTIRIERRGEAAMTLYLAPPNHAVTPSWMRWSGGEIELEAHTQQLSIQVDPHSALLVFRYALYSSKQPLGVFFHQYSAVSSIPAYAQLPGESGENAC